MASDIGAAFRALHEADGAFLIPNPWDAGSAKMMHSLSFKALASASAGFAAAIAKKDGKTSREEALENCRQLAEATPLPVNGDLEKGHGDSPEDAAETVRLAAAAGLAGCSIEDYSGETIYEFDHAVERVSAAVEAARSLPGDFMLTARPENLVRGRIDLDDTIRRLQAFEAAGADVLYAPGLGDLDQVRAVTERLVKDRERLLTFYDFPAEHWKHIRTSNPIESTFATVRQRTVKTKGCLSRKTALAMTFKLILSAKRKWRKLDGSSQLAELIEGVPFKDGIKQIKHAA